MNRLDNQSNVTNKIKDQKITAGVLFALHYLSQKSRIYFKPIHLDLSPLIDCDDVLISSNIAEEVQSFLFVDQSCSQKLFNFFQLRKSLLYDELKRQLDLVDHFKGAFIAYNSKRYPPLLRMIKDPPLGLFCRGYVPHLTSPKVAIVGARKASIESLHFSRMMGQKLEETNVVTVSGGAFGCDINAHLGVLNSSSSIAKAIVVMPSGLDLLVPKSNGNIFNQLLTRGGLFVSERPFGSKCIRQDFIIRNRIIAGFVMDLVLIEAAKRSGALSTSRYAVENGRNVYVWNKKEFNGDIRKHGGLTLIQEGAISFDHFEAFRLKLMTNRECNFN